MQTINQRRALAQARRPMIGFTAEPQRVQRVSRDPVRDAAAVECPVRTAGDVFCAIAMAVVYVGVAVVIIDAIVMGVM